MPFIARQRSRLAVLAVLALVGSLLAVSAVPVAADDGTVDNEAMYSACVGAATVGAKFGDMAGSFAEDAANCLAHYGITTGTAAGVFSPNASITRLQMALFLTRAAGPAGIVLPAASDQGLTDIGGMTQGIQDAINQAAELGIMSSRSAGVFDPTGMVTREDMAVHLAAFLSDATTGPGGQDIDDEDFSGDDTVLTDISGVTYSAYGAIRDLYDLGVTTGTSDTTFSPTALVSRGQMAVFITRALAHTNARPAGLTVQASPTAVFVGESVNLEASIRDANHRPVVDASVDFFQLQGSDDEAFTDDGSCSSDIKDVSSTHCDITASDNTTDSRGNVSDSFTVDDDTMVWGWTGDLGDAFDNDETDSVTLDISAAEPAKKTQLTDDRAADRVKFGETVTFTFQLIDKNGDPVSKEGETVVVASEIKATKGSPEQNSGRTDTHTTDASGRIELSFSENDPDGDEGKSNEVTLTLKVSKLSKGSDAVDGDGNKVPNEITVIWSDGSPAAFKLVLSAASKYHEASDEGNGVGNTVRATLTDQYGDPVADAIVAFTSEDTADSQDGKVKVGAPDISRHTNRRGVASLGYQRDSDKAGAETFNASHTIVNGLPDDAMPKPPNDDPKDEDPIKAIPYVHYWATEVGASNSAGKNIVAVDTGNNTIVVGDKSPEFVEYDSNDHFNVDGKAKVLADFEKALEGLAANEGSLSWTLLLDADGKVDRAGPNILELKT